MPGEIAGRAVSVDSDAGTLRRTRGEREKVVGEFELGLPGRRHRIEWEDRREGVGLSQGETER